MFLSDRTIRRLVDQGVIGIDPFDPGLVQPCSLDLRLEEIEGGLKHLDPHQFALASTLEYVRLPSHIAGVVAGKSTWARLGLIVESAGFVDAGFEGKLTLELCNISSEALVLPNLVAICQIVFNYLDEPAQKPYSGKYQGQTGPTPAR